MSSKAETRTYRCRLYCPTQILIRYVSRSWLTEEGSGADFSSPRQRWKRTHAVDKVRFQVQRLRSVGIPRTSRVLLPRSIRLPGLTHSEIHPLGAWFPGQIRVILLFLTRLPLHHQDHSQIGTQILKIRVEGVSPTHQEQSAHVVVEVLWFASSQVATGQEDPFRHHEQLVSASSRYSRDLRHQGKVAIRQRLDLTRSY